MKIIQVPFTYYPDPVGGTEIYVESLVRELATLGVACTIAAPGDVSSSYQWGNSQVRRFSVSSQIDNVADMYGEGDEQAAAEFEKILELEKPDLVHLHAHTRAISVKLVDKIKARKIPVVFTYHTPTVTCQRGTMLRWGRSECDGFMDPVSCSACCLQGKGLPRLISEGIARLPLPLVKGLGKMGLRGGAWTALRMRELVTLKHKTTHSFLQSIDHIVAVCQWVQKVLLRNSIPPNKITLCRQGLSHQLPENPPCSTSKVANEVFRLVYLGRLDPTKGVDLLIKALALMPDNAVSLDIYGISQGEGGKAYETQLSQLAKIDTRIHFFAPIPGDKILETLEQYDALVVPSRWMETGPLVVLEAFAAGISIIGSHFGGISELIQDGVNGVLVRNPTPEEWAKAIKAQSERNTPKMESTKNVRTMKEVAQSMEQKYKELLNNCSVL